MYIRKIRQEDIPEIIDIIDNHYKLYGDFVNLYKYDSDLISTNFYELSGGCFWVFILQQKIIGIIAVLPLDKDTLELKRFYVIPFWHGKKIAELLLNQAELFAVNKKFKKIILWTDSRYDRAKSFYLKNNFKKIKQEIKNDADNEYCAVLYEKIL